MAAALCADGAQIKPLSRTVLMAVNVSRSFAIFLAWDHRHGGPGGTAPARFPAVGKVGKTCAANLRENGGKCEERAQPIS